MYEWIGSPDTVELYRLPTVIVSLPIHILTFLFIVAVFISILTTKHLHTRPQRLFIINCGFFLIASLYDLLFDVGYLFIVNKQITVQTCSIVRNFIYNPIAVQGFVDALERFCIAFFDYEMSTTTVFSLYTLFPVICVCLAIYNTFISTTLLETDDVCAIIRRTQWTNISLVIIQWGSAVIAVLIYVAIWIELKRRFANNKTVTSQSPIKTETDKLCIQRYYWDSNIVRVFFVCCALPILLSIPSIIFTFLSDISVYQNSVANVIATIILDLTTLLTWIAYICYISHIRHSILELFQCRSTSAQTTTEY